MEDLRVSDPCHPEWSNITEVKGYSGGGRTSDLQAISRFAGVFQSRNGRPPGSRWYVVNQFREHDPEVRQELLSGADEDVAEFAKDGGLAIDTRQLFRMVSDIIDEKLTADDARRLLRESVGRLPY